MDLKLGALPATRPNALGDLELYAVAGRLPRPPAAFAVPRAAYPIDGNDEYGDCTIAGVAHLIEAWNVAEREKDLVPSSQGVLETYFGLSGGEDTGLVEADVLHGWYTKGLFGAKIAGYAPVPPQNLLNLHQAIAFYGGVYLGIDCPLSAQEQFENHEPWTFVEGSEIVGGHCIVGLGFDRNGDLECATWGGIVKVTAGFRAHFFTEAWCALSHQIVERKKDSLGINIATLQADLKRV